MNIIDHIYVGTIMTSRKSEGRRLQYILYHQRNIQTHIAVGGIHSVDYIAGHIDGAHIATNGGVHPVNGFPASFYLREGANKTLAPLTPEDIRRVISRSHILQSAPGLLDVSSNDPSDESRVSMGLLHELEREEAATRRDITRQILALSKHLR